MMAELHVQDIVTLDSTDIKKRSKLKVNLHRRSGAYGRRGSALLAF